MHSPLQLLLQETRFLKSAHAHSSLSSGIGLNCTKFRLKLKKVGETTRPFSYDLNQIPYDYTVEVRNRFKGLDLIDRVPDEMALAGGSSPRG